MGTRVIGYSSTEEWYERAGFEALLSNPESWESAANGGQSVESWADPDDDAWTLPVFSPTTEPITRVVMQVGFLTANATKEQVATWTQMAIENCRAVFPSLAEIVLEAPNGGPNSNRRPFCTRNGQPVYACTIRGPVVKAIGLIVAGGVPGLSVSSGLHPNVDACSQFRDKTGHFTEAGARAIAAKYAAFYEAGEAGGSLPPVVGVG